MARHMVKVHEVISRCPDVVSVRLERPADYSFRAGQYLVLELDTAEGVERKPFTHSSAPHDPHLEITTRISGSPFKSALQTLAPGDEVAFFGPAGRFSVPAAGPPVALLAGGVGITPVISVLRAWEEAGEWPVQAVLFYGNRDTTCVPFAEEIDGLVRRMGLAVVHVPEVAPDSWKGEHGFIDGRLLKARLEEAERWLFTVTGPPVMVDAMERLLDELDAPHERRLIERFSATGTGG